MTLKKKKGRPKTRPETKLITFNLSLESIKKLKIMTSISRNDSAFIERLINLEYNKTIGQRFLNGKN